MCIYVGLKLAMRDIILGDKIAMVGPLFSTSADMGICYE